MFIIQISFIIYYLFIQITDKLVPIDSYRYALFNVG